MLTLSAFIAVMAVLSACLLAVRFAVPPTSRKRWVSTRLLIRALVPRRILRSRSGRLDIAAFLFSSFGLTALLGWAFVSTGAFAAATDSVLIAMVGPTSESSTPAWVATAALTVGVYLTYEFVYWLNHWLSHRLPVLWHFHKVHHSAESLSTLTNFRVHPVDTLLFGNMAAAATGIMAGAIIYAFGRPVGMWSVGGTNLLIFISAWLLTNLQHSHLWMSFHGSLGKILISPAHHQIHHSTDPRHHNHNFGATLAVWDWFFGTLHVPTKNRERLRFGVDGMAYNPHGFVGAVLMPFVDAAPQRMKRPTQSTGASVPSR
jgi:sterol desaturase/sphingolipid hydroxylase (fatty acid hydroxylase superfamily)